MSFVEPLSLGIFFLFAILGAYLIITKRGNAKSNRLLGLFFILWALNFLDGWLLLTEKYLDFPHLALWEKPFTLVYGPIILFYVKSFKTPKLKLKASHLWHLVPFFLLFSLTLFEYHLKPVSVKLNILKSVVTLEQPPEVFIPFLLIFLHIAIYLVLTSRLINEEVKRLKNHFSSLEKFHLNWLQQTVAFIALIILLSFITSVLQFFSTYLWFEVALIVLTSVLFVFIAGVLMKALEQPAIFGEINVAGKNTSSSLPLVEQNKIASLIQNKMSNDKIYLNPGLTVEELAGEINFPVKKVSQAINQAFNQNFFDFVNKFRIEEAKKLISSPADPRQTIIEVMYQVGFNSKSSFNTQFKKRTGLTPTEFKKVNSQVNQS